MKEISEATREKILASAKKEFLDKGFSGASLRTIAANAGLTTGAMYRHFKDKDALFCALVDGAAEYIEKVIKNSGLEYHQNSADAAGEAHRLDEKKILKSVLNYIYSNFDTFNLLFTKAAGSTHEDFIDDVSVLFTKNCIEICHWMMKEYGVKKDIDDMSIHMLANLMINSYAEIIQHKMKKKEAQVFIENISSFWHFGFMHMLGLPCDH